ncbi:alanine-zipper protein, partial [Roseburia inulinivorans]|uniref:alanine-zipper protein n=1 Tax=Roseburia inulinivorans TaxID=360807 RepID=UPI003FEEB2E6
MYQVSEALDKVISGSGRTFYARLNGISDGIQEIVQTNFSTPDSYFYVGGAIASKIEVSMFTKTQEFVKGTEVRFEIGAMADGAIEWIPMGYFTIKEQKKDRNLLTFTAYDRLESKLAKAYKSKITKYPAESKEFLTDISEQTGIEFDTSKLSDSLMIDKILTVNDQSGEKTYKEPFDGFTMQQVVGYIAQLHGTFAICDRSGKVTFRWYEALATDYPGKIGDTAGSYLKDQNLSFIYNTIEFLKESHTYLIKTNRYFDDLLQSETMCQISGISCDTENDHYESGTNINTNLSNPVMTQEWLNKILKKIKDMSYYPVSFSFMGDPRLDVGDIVTIVDAKNNLIDVPVMQHTITFDGGLLSEVASYGFEEKEAKSPSQIALQRVKDDILTLQEITAKKATFYQLNAVDAKITNLQASSITVNDANILFARLDKANIEQGWITSVMIGDAQITNAKIQGMSADKLTAGTIDASIITVKNLDADSITVGKINWKQLSDDVNTTITDSKNTANNALNAANSSVQNVIIEYYSSTSKDQPVNGTWQTDSPDWVEGRYIWCRTKTVTKSGVISYSDASCITGNTGAKGDKGIPGINGENGKTTYLHIAYANSADGTSGFSTNDSTNKLYIGQYIDFIEEDSTLPSAYQWTKIKGDTGAKGDKGDQGVKALQPTRNWTGTFTTIGIVQGAVIGDFNRTPVVGDVFLNLDGSSNTGTWEVTAISGTNVSIKLLAYVKSKGADGKNGSSVTITSKSVTYQTSVSGVTVPSGTWNADVPNVPNGQYLWTRTVVNYSDGTSITSYSVGYKGVNGSNGSNGKGVQSTAVTYQAWGNGTNTPTGGWSPTPLDTSADKPYLWTRTIITYTDGSSSTSYSVGSTLKGVSVGARNLAESTNQGITGWYWGMQTGGYTRSEVVENNVKTCKLLRDSVAQTGWSVIYYDRIGRYKWEPDTVYTVSVDVKPSVSTAIGISFREGNGTNNLITSERSETIQAQANKWNRLVWNVKTVSTLPTSTGQVLYATGMNSGTGVWYQFKNLKIEKGNQATDWTPAPEDVDSGINNAQSTANSASSKADTAQSSANAAQSTANSASSKADTAQSSANA